MNLKKFQSQFVPKTSFNATRNVSASRKCAIKRKTAPMVVTNRRVQVCYYISIIIIILLFFIVSIRLAILSRPNNNNTYCCGSFSRDFPVYFIFLSTRFFLFVCLFLFHFLSHSKDCLIFT